MKFTNKTGMELPNVDWIAGVDYDDLCYTDDPLDPQNDESSTTDSD